MPISTDRKMNTKLAKIKMAGYFKITNCDSFILQVRELKPGRFGGLNYNLRRKPICWKLNFLIHEFLTVNQK